MFVFRKIWRALYSWNTRFEIRLFALLPTKYYPCSHINVGDSQIVAIGRILNCQHITRCTDRSLQNTCIFRIHLSSVKKKTVSGYWKTLLLWLFPKTTTVLMASENKTKKKLYIYIHFPNVKKSRKYLGIIISKKQGEKISPTISASQDETLYMLKW